ncbi:MAG: hypothetical protein MI867_07675, partial [Pseudomonadales bacterium]|nr:hypothetical protein [Pseudomonadales bacterium]
MGLFKDKLPVGLTLGPYEYNYTYLPPLAFADGIHIQDLPKPRWLILVAKNFLKILVNGFLANAEEAYAD